MAETLACDPYEDLLEFASEAEAEAEAAEGDGGQWQTLVPVSPNDDRLEQGREEDHSGAAAEAAAP